MTARPSAEAKDRGAMVRRARLPRVPPSVTEKEPMTTSNRSTTIANDTQVLAGIKKDLPNASNLPLLGATYDTASLTALVESRVDAAKAVLTARATYLAAVGAYRTLNTKVTPIVRALRQYVINVYGPTAAQLADFGFEPNRQATQTVEQKQAAVARRAATRKARGTTGKKQKASITGDNPTGAPATAPAAAPAATPTPATAPQPAATTPKS